MSDYFGELGTETKDFWNKVDPDWDGGASEAAAASLGKMGLSFEDASKRLKKLSKAYNVVAAGVYNFTGTLATLLRQLGDYGIAALASAAAGTASFETVVGPIVGYIAAGASVVKVIQTVRDIFKAFGYAWSIAEALSGQCALWLGLSHGSGARLPSTTLVSLSSRRL